MRLIAIAILAFAMMGCHGDPPVVGVERAKQPDLKENMINANRTIAQSEETVIDEYVSRRGWPMKKLSSGARYWEYEIGDGKQVDYEDSVRVMYNIEAINGKKIYTGVEEIFVAGRRQEMIGLDDVVLHLHEGSKARVILPSSLAYGIGGDGDRIKQSMILVLELKILIGD